LFSFNSGVSEWRRSSKRYPMIMQDAARIKGSAILDAETVWLDASGMADFQALHSRSNDGRATALTFDHLMLKEEHAPQILRRAQGGVPTASAR
jgi:ATP-dependent DNA ligase